MHPEVGAWVCTDQRMTEPGRDGDEGWTKHVSIVCPDGIALLAYTGLARLSDGTEVSDWVRWKLTGATRTLAATVAHLQERATAQISSDRRFGLQVLSFGLAILDDSGMAFVTIDNRGPQGVRRQFDQRAGRVASSAHWAAGSGVPLVRASDLDLLQRISGRRPRQPENYSRLLATINRRAAERRDARAAGVSPWAHVVFVPADRSELVGGSYVEPGERASARLRPPPLVIWGTDCTDDVVAASMAAAARTLRGTPTGVRYRLTMPA